MNAVDAGDFVAVDAWQDVPAGVEKRSLARGLVLVGTYFALYGATLVDAVAPLPLALNLVFGIGNGICIAMLFILGHDCCHGSLVPGRRWNLWLGRFVFVPVVHSVSLWRLLHNKCHHSRTNLKGVDPVWAPMSPEQYAAAPAVRRWLERVYRSPFGPLIYYYGEVWLRFVLFPISADARAQWKRHIPDTIFVLTGLAFTITVILLFGAVLAPQRSLWLTLVLGWVVPFAVWNYLAAITIYLNHTHPEIPWFAEEKLWRFYNVNVEGTAHVKMPFDILPLYSEVLTHSAHHTTTSLPVYALADKQADLKARFGSEVREYELSLAEYRRIVASCKLFDFKRMCWTDFAGSASGPAFAVPAPVSAEPPF